MGFWKAEEIRLEGKIFIWFFRYRFGGIIMAEANLLVTFEPVHLESAKKEIENILKETKEKAKLLKAEEGLAEISASDAQKLVKAVVGIAKKDEKKFCYTFNWWPVDKWCKAEVKDMQKVISELEKGIKSTDKWKLDITKRKTDKEYGRDFIIKLTEVIDKPKVDLSNPDKIIKIEIIGNKAAISLISKDNHLNIARLK